MHDDKLLFYNLPVLNGLFILKMDKCTTMPHQTDFPTWGFGYVIASAGDLSNCCVEYGSMLKGLFVGRTKAMKLGEQSDAKTLKVLSDYRCLLVRDWFTYKHAQVGCIYANHLPSKWEVMASGVLYCGWCAEPSLARILGLVVVLQP